MVSELIPSEAFDSGAIRSADAAIIICSALLHDIGMHMSEPSFEALVSKETAFAPVKWFSENSILGEKDNEWHELWVNYIKEVNRFDSDHLTKIIGPLDSGGLDTWRFEGLPNRPRDWSKSDRLIVGEFIRRHHGRMAHEIALHGFPGLDSKSFPRLDETIPNLADLAGLVARSHSIPLRDAHRYLEYAYSGDLRPRGAAVLYHMALLRLSDYLQLQPERAPVALLKMRDPQSKISIDEWSKHKAVANISYDHRDTKSVKFDVNADHTLSIHFQLDRLFRELQGEMDMCAAVLSEYYGSRGDNDLDLLRIAKVRVRSNLFDDALLESLPYLPIKASFVAHPKLVNLIIEPLYGPNPSIGVRELIQNAIDATRERETTAGSLTAEQSVVRVELDLRQADKPILRIVDHGIGMDAHTVVKYFLKAGASYRHSPEWRSRFLDPNGKVSVLRSGRFGIGAYAAFLLGDTIGVTSKGITASEGIKFEATLSDETIQITRAKKAATGTEIEVFLRPEVASVALHQLESIKMWGVFLKTGIRC